MSIDGNHYFRHSNFYLHKEFVQSTKLLFNYTIIFVIPASIEAQEIYFPFSLSSLRLEVMENGYGERNVRMPHIMADPGSGGPWEWWTLVVVVPGSGGPWEWQTLREAGRQRLENDNVG